MKYQSLGSSPGSLVPKNVRENLMQNPGKTQNYDLAETYRLRENTMVADLVAFFLRSPVLSKAEEYWNYFNSQWKQNIVNYIKHTTVTQTVLDTEIEHYKNHYQHRTAIRMVEEYVKRSREVARIKERFPTVTPETNRTVFGIQKALDNIHARLMVFSQQIRASLDNPESTMVKR